MTHITCVCVCVCVCEGPAITLLSSYYSAGDMYNATSAFKKEKWKFDGL